MKSSVSFVPFLNFFGKIVATRAKTSSSWRWRDVKIGVAQNVNSPNYFNGVRHLTMAAIGKEAAAERVFVTARTSVWWDMEKCNVPEGCDAHNITDNIRSALLKYNYRGPVTFYAYGDLSNTKISTDMWLVYVPSGVKDGYHRMILADMLLWAMEHQAPANVMLMSGDGDFSYVLNRLRMKTYNILLVLPENTSPYFLILAPKTILPYRSIFSEPESGSEVCKQAQPNKQMFSEPEVRRFTWFCDKCNVTRTSLVDFKYHLSGKRHKKKDGQALLASQSADVEPKKPCGVVVFARSVSPNMGMEFISQEESRRTHLKFKPEVLANCLVFDVDSRHNLFCAPELYMIIQDI